MKILDKLGKEPLFYDGATGTYLQSHGLKLGEIPENLNIDNKDILINMHIEYLESGADIILANTFGANRLKLKDNKYSVKEVIEAGINNAKSAILKSKKEAFVSLDIGPTGKILKPFGDLDFNDAYEIFKEMVIAGSNAGADLITIETFTDLYELKAAILAANENSNLPIITTVTFEDNKKMLTGADTRTFITLAEGLGVDALGINCGLGPREIEPILKEVLEYATIPVVVNANAGLPTLVDGKTVFNVDSDEFSDYAKRFIEMGASVIGGCCGTDPDYIKKIVTKSKKLKLNRPENTKKTVVSSYEKYLEFNKTPVLIGERINPTGKKFLKEALKSDDISVVLELALAQEEEGSHALDINCGLPEVDETTMLPRLIKEIQAVSSLPLQLDSGNSIALENAARIYNGIPLINSVSGKSKSLDEVLPVAKKYGAVCIALLLDDDGIPKTKEKRLEIADKILEEGKKLGIGPERFIFDPLALTISSEPDGAKIALDTVKELSNRGLKTSLGVSNISFGLPAREILNSNFFTLAIYNGLSAGIINTNSEVLMGAYYSAMSLLNYDKNSLKFIERYKDLEISKKTRVEVKNVDSIIENDDKLKVAIEKGLIEETEKLTKKELEKKSPLEIINNSLVPALSKVGDEFESGKKFLPQLLMSADAASAAFKILDRVIKSDDQGNKKEREKIILATVKGDIHDIGKNITKSLLESYGFYVIDLGKDVEPSAVLEKLKETDARVIGLSSLMTTTLPYVDETIKLVREYDPKIKIVVGGAVVSENYIEKVKASCYGKDAMATVRFMEKFEKEN